MPTKLTEKEKKLALSLAVIDDRPYSDLRKGLKARIRTTLKRKKDDSRRDS